MRELRMSEHHVLVELSLRMELPVTERGEDEKVVPSSASSPPIGTIPGPSTCASSRTGRRWPSVCSYP